MLLLVVRSEDARRLGEDRRIEASAIVADACAHNYAQQLLG
jgi:hypothetical protein